MTEYWVSQGNKWCEFCKIFINNNPATIRNHEMGQRHKDNVTNRITDMRKEKAAKQKKEEESARALEQIEAKANKSYKKDVESFQEAKEAHASCLNDKGGDQAWEFDSSSGYYIDQQSGIYYDSNSGFYYSDAVGNWVTREEAFAAAAKKPVGGGVQKQEGGGLRKSFTASGLATEKSDTAAPGPVVSHPLNPKRSVKGATSSISVQKRKRDDENQRKVKRPVSAKESAAIKAREAARQRVVEREKNLMGLYGR